MENGKEIRVRGSYPYEYTIYADGSMDAKCTICKRFEHVQAATAEKIRYNPKWFESFTCNSCFRTKKNAAPDPREDDIIWGQAINLAQAMVVAQHHDKRIGPDDRFYWEEMDAWAERYYAYLRDKRASRAALREAT